MLGTRWIKKQQLDIPTESCLIHCYKDDHSNLAEATVLNGGPIEGEGEALYFLFNASDFYSHHHLSYP